MNLKHIVSQLGFLNESAVRRVLNSCIYPLRRYALIEIGKDEPNIIAIKTCRTLEAVIAELDPEHVHTLDSTALFVFNAQEDERPEAERKQRARALLVREIADGRSAPPRSKAELDTRIKTIMHKQMEDITANFGKAAKAVGDLESLGYAHTHEEIDNENGIGTRLEFALTNEYDQHEIPEYVQDALISKVVDAAIRVYSDGVRQLARARVGFQETEALALKQSAVLLAGALGVTEDELEVAVHKQTTRVEDLFAKLENTEATPTIDTPPEGATPSEKAKRQRVAKAMAAGISSADMAMAGGVK